MCQCDCGKVHIATAAHLKSGEVASCGCLKKELFAAKASEMARGNHTRRTHGKTGSRLYGIWNGMKQRCDNHKRNRYDHYGNRGIAVCDEWLNDFQAFYDWAMANGYSDNLTIDRKDNDKGYSPDNCRWATYKDQANNTSKNRKIYYKGETLTISAAAKQYGIDYNTLWARIVKYHWSTEKAIETPVMK